VFFLIPIRERAIETLVHGLAATFRRSTFAS